MVLPGVQQQLRKTPIDSVAVQSHSVCLACSPNFEAVLAVGRRLVAGRNPDHSGVGIPITIPIPNTNVHPGFQFPRLPGIGRVAGVSVEEKEPAVEPDNGAEPWTPSCPGSSASRSAIVLRPYGDYD
jgi:hypothetical protein